MFGPAFLWLAIAAGSAVQAAPCDALLPSPREVNGRRVGPSSCAMRETAVTLDGRAFRRLDVGLDGTVEGYLAKIGDYREYLTNGPDLVFPQTWGPRPIFLGIAAYERDKGAAFTLLFPADAAAWNGKMFVMVHGRGVSFADGSLRAWDKNLDPARPAADVDKYDRLLLAKGYAVVKTHRTTTEGRGEITTTLEDGTTVDYAAFNDTARYVMDFSEVAGNVVASRLGRAPSRVYLYGHSAGARLGHSVNFTPGLNTRSGGRPFFDGILADDPAAGTWYPVVIKGGKDVLFTTADSRAAMVPEIDVVHQMYNNIWPPHHPDWMSSSYLENKRNVGRIARDKGLTRYRMYEVRGISHSGGENAASDGREHLANLDLSLMMDRFIDMLDAWVEKGVPPPPTRSDWPELGDGDQDGILENAALAFPEVACPLGVFFPYPTTTSGTTRFAAFTGRGLEPLDTKNVFMDMNRNGVWDYRETPTEAWRRLGLLGRDEVLTRERYVSCVRRAADRLRKDGFFSDRTVEQYLQQAGKAELPSPRIP